MLCFLETILLLRKTIILFPETKVFTILSGNFPLLMYSIIL